MPPRSKCKHSYNKENTNCYDKFFSKANVNISYSATHICYGTLLADCVDFATLRVWVNDDGRDIKCIKLQLCHMCANRTPKYHIASNCILIDNNDSYFHSVALVLCLQNTGKLF